MNEYDFILKFDLPDCNTDPDVYVDALYEAGCDDAGVGIGQNGRIALNFIRESPSAIDAITSAITDVKKAIPGARLIEATPDLVGLTDIADIVGCSRQNIRKLFFSHKSVFPAPVHEGSVSLWHLFNVLQWFKSKGDYKIEDTLIEVSNANMQVNVTRQVMGISPSAQKNFKALLI